MQVDNNKKKREEFLEKVRTVEEFNDADDYTIFGFYDSAARFLSKVSPENRRKALRFYADIVKSGYAIKDICVIPKGNDLIVVRSDQVRDNRMTECSVDDLAREFPHADREVLISFVRAMQNNPDFKACKEESLRDALMIGIRCGGLFNKGQLNLVIRSNKGVKIVSVVESYQFLIELAKKNLGYNNIIVKTYTEKEVEGTDAKCLFDMSAHIPYKFLHNGECTLESVSWVAIFSNGQPQARYRKCDLLERARIVKIGDEYHTKINDRLTRHAGNFWNSKTAYTDAVDMLKKTAVKEFLKTEMSLDSVQGNLVKDIDVSQYKMEINQ